MRVYFSRLVEVLPLFLRVCAFGMSPASLYIDGFYGNKKLTYKGMAELPFEVVRTWVRKKGCNDSHTCT